MTQIVPGFQYKQIPCNYTSEHWDWSLGLILHVATGGGDMSLYGWFSRPDASASSHWWVGASGGAEQYLDPVEHQSWAQADGNASYHSVESGGNPEDPLTDAQINSIARIYAWGAKYFGWPYQLAENPGEKGLGWHGMGGASFGGHVFCPGELRKAQRQEILRRAQALNRPKTAATAPSSPTLAQGVSMASLPDWFNYAHDYEYRNMLLGSRPANSDESVAQMIMRIKSMHPTQDQMALQLQQISKDIAAIKDHLGMSQP